VSPSHPDLLENTQQPPAALRSSVQHEPAFVAPRFQPIALGRLPLHVDNTADWRRRKCNDSTLRPRLNKITNCKDCDRIPGQLEAI
jgi:hypothetical protein